MAHPDDLEIAAFHGIHHCYESNKNFFGGIICTNGSKSPRSGAYKNISDQEMIEIRRKEQHEAAKIGRYAFVAELAYQSSQIKSPTQTNLSLDLKNIFSLISPQIVYTHNPFDRHQTHQSVFHHTLGVLRALPHKQRPKTVYACEVWGSLDWLPNEYKIYLDVTRPDDLAEKLLRTFKSQIHGGKAYDQATLGRRKANASYSSSHTLDQATDIILALDLSALMDPKVKIKPYLQEILKTFLKSMTL